MDARSFEAVTRRAALLTMGSAGLAALATPLTTNAKKKRKNRNRNKKQNKGDVNKLCKQQVAQCSAGLAPLCEENPLCPAILDCCSFFGTCNVAGFVECLADVGQQPSERLLG